MITLSADYAAAVLAAVVLSVVAMESPVLDSMDLFQVAESAAPGFRMSGTDGSLRPYLLLASKFVVGDALWAGKALAVFAAVGCVAFSTRMLGPWAGLWVLAQAGVLLAVQQADPVLPGLFFFLSSLSLSARGSAVWAAVFGAASVGCATWLWPFILGALWVSHRRLLTACTLCIATSCLALCDVAVLPVFAWPTGASLQGLVANSTWLDLGLQLGLLSILWGSFRGNRASRGLAFTLLVGLVGAIIIPATPPLLLHIQICLALGVAAVETGPALLLVSLVVLGLRLPDAWNVSPQEEGRRQVIQAMSGRRGEAMCTTRTFIRRAPDGWLQGCIGLEYMGRPSTTIYPAHVLTHAKRMNLDWFVLEDRAVLHTYPWLQELLSPPYPPGFSVAVEAEGWRVFNLDLGSGPDRGP